MKLTLSGQSALDLAILNKEGVDMPFELSPYKTAKAYIKLIEELNQLRKNLGNKKYTPHFFSREFNYYIKYFNERGKEYKQLKK